MARYDLDLRMGIDDKLVVANEDVGALSYSVDKQNLYIDALKEDKATIERQMVNADKAYAIRNENEDIVAKSGYGNYSFQSGLFEGPRAKIKLIKTEGYVDATYDFEVINNVNININNDYILRYPAYEQDGIVRYFKVNFINTNRLFINNFSVQFYAPDYDIEYELIDCQNGGAFGNYSYAEGYATKASGNHSHAEGSFTEASGDGSHAEGSNTVASEQRSHAEGNATTASGRYSHAEGSSSTASNTAAHAEGTSTTASGQSSHAEGKLTTAFGDYSHVEGYYSETSGNYSHAEGYETKAGGDQSHTEGYCSEANGNSSHAEGYETKASGNQSHAEGYKTEASGDYSHAEGYKTIASGSDSHASGYETIASSNCGAAFGFYNKPEDDDGRAYLFTIGNGQDPYGNISRSNVLALHSDSIELNENTVIDAELTVNKNINAYGNNILYGQTTFQNLPVYVYTDKEGASKTDTLVNESKLNDLKEEIMEDVREIADSIITDVWYRSSSPPTTVKQAKLLWIRYDGTSTYGNGVLYYFNPNLLNENLTDAQVKLESNWIPMSAIYS